MPGRKFNSGDYRFGFNGMERDDELKGEGNSYDFGARMYDNRIGRWLSVDPLSHKFPDRSPFIGIGNNPIVYIDPDGKENILYIVFVQNDKVKLTKQHRDAIVKRAQDIYANSGVNVKVIGIESKGFYNNEQLGKLDATDRMTYVSDYGTLHKELKKSYDPKFGMSDNEGLTSMNHNGSGIDIGFFHYSKSLEPGNQYWNTHPDEKNHEGKYIDEHSGLIKDNMIEIDGFSYIARGAIHEGGGHGLLGQYHPSDIKNWDQAKRYSKYTDELNIMLDGGSQNRFRFPQELEPGLFDFLYEDWKILMEHYGPGNVKYEVCPNDGTGSQESEIKPNKEPTDNFQND